MSLSQQQRSAFSSQYHDVPSSAHENSNRAIFGGWTMYRLFQAAFDHHREFSAHTTYAAVAHDSPDFEIVDFDFIQPGIVERPMMLDVSHDECGQIVVVCKQDMEGGVYERVASATYNLGLLVNRYGDEELEKVHDMMRFLDMAGGLYVNFANFSRYEGAQEAKKVCVTKAIAGLKIYDVRGYQREDNAQEFMGIEDMFMSLTGGDITTLKSDHRYQVTEGSRLASERASSVIVSCEGHARGEMVFVETDPRSERILNPDDTVPRYGVGPNDPSY